MLRAGVTWAVLMGFAVARRRRLLAVRKRLLRRIVGGAWCFAWYLKVDWKGWCDGESKKLGRVGKSFGS